MGRITLKQVYEIAKYHATSEWNIARDLTEREIIPMVIEEARKLGVEVKFKHLSGLNAVRSLGMTWQLWTTRRLEIMLNF